jgi:hypothetical protein
MTDDPFEACWHRWERADSRRQEVVTVWNDYVDRQTHECRLVHQGQGVHILQVIENEPIPEDFAVLFGEWLYNLRASLDSSSGGGLRVRHTAANMPPLRYATASPPVAAK